MTPKITEEQFQQQVFDLAHLYGWKVAHFRPAMTAKGWRTPVSADGKGFPDAVLVKPGRQVIFAEFKRDGAQLSLEQAEWGQSLIAAGAMWQTWRPKDFEAIQQLLSEEL